MQFSLPQFIDVEDRVIGPLTLRQFLWLLAGGAIIFILWGFLKIWMLIILAIPVIALAAAFAFLRPQGRSLITYLLSIIRFATGPKQFVWKKTSPARIKKEIKKKEVKGPTAPATVKVSESQLKDLAWTLDTKARGTPIKKKGK